MKETYDKLSSAVSSRLVAAARARTALLVASAIAAAVSGAAQFISADGAAKLTPLQIVAKLTPWQTAGIFATLIIMAIALYVAFQDADASAQLEAARAALDKAREYDQREQQNTYNVKILEGDVERATRLYLSVMQMRGALERMEPDSKASVSELEVKITKDLFLAAYEHLPATFGFENNHFWTIGVYRAEAASDGPGKELVLIDNRRSIPCELTKARRWREGTGFAGLAFTNCKEVVVEDASHPAVSSVFGATKGLKPDDAKKYVSFAIAPISVDGDDGPWGVAIATSNRSGHFTVDEQGVQPIEGVRALAGMVALGVSLARRYGKHGDSGEDNGAH